MLDRPQRNAILLTDEAGEGHWKLGAFPAGDGLGVMIGWTVESPEGGVPTSVSSTLIRAMSTYGRITFPCSTVQSPATDSWTTADPDATARLPIAPQGWRRLLTWGKMPTIQLLSTRRSDLAHVLFDDPYYQWWNASQFALVSCPAETPPTKLSPLPHELFEDNWSQAVPQLTASGVDMILRAGVDGEVCGLAFRSTSVRRQFETMFDMAAAEYGFSVSRVSYRAFGEILSKALDNPISPDAK